uniref:Uncharacterized protein n=1 Tax=Cucumis melo TaxID=3656 RepID=A0A9I9EMK4_CUCME
MKVIEVVVKKKKLLKHHTLHFNCIFVELSYTIESEEEGSSGAEEFWLFFQELKEKGELQSGEEGNSGVINYKINAYTKADLQCTNAYTKEVESCLPSDANINNVVKIGSVVGGTYFGS